MNRIRSIVLAAALVVSMGTVAQKSIIREVCWIDGNINEAQTASSLIDLSTLTMGLHSYTIRVQDSEGVWSSPTTKFFIIPLEDKAATAIAEQEYWIDGKIVSRTTLGASPAEISLVDLSPGLHSMTVRVKDDTGVWGSPTTKFFIIPLEDKTATAIAEQEYWIDGKIAARTSLGASPAEISLDDLSAGLHSLTVRVKDDTGVWSSPMTKFFIIPQEEQSSTMARYMYWFDSDSEHLVSGVLTDFSGILPIDIGNLSEGDHTLSWSVADSKGAWSGVKTETFTFTKTAITESMITMAQKSYEYTAEDIEPELTVVDGSTTLVKGDDYEVTYANNHNTGMAVATITGKAAYKESFEVQFAITKAPLTIKAKDYTIKQGEELPTLEMEYEGFKNKETAEVLTTQATIATTATSASEPGTYDITVSGAEAANYELTFVKGTLTIAAADPVTITAKSYEIEYGDELPTFEFTSEGAALVGTPAITCDIPEGAPAGTYPIVISKGSVTNYNDMYVNGSLAITKAPLTIKAKDYTIKQGEELPIFEMEYEGFKNGETAEVLTTQATIATTATSASEPGTYDITVSGAEAANYELTFVKGTLTIAAADPVTITAKSYEIEYGDELPTFEFTSEGAALVGTPAITCDIPEGAPAGTYPIVISKGGVTNYNDTYVNGTLTITKAKLTITADDIEVHQDEVMPTLTWKAEGWKNDEDESVLTVQPVCTTEGSPTSSLGDYTITIGGAEAANYDITYVNGKLTVSVPVGITSIDANVAPADIYTLQGIKVRSKSESLDGLADGYYIVNRRKVLIRRR